VYLVFGVLAEEAGVVLYEPLLLSTVEEEDQHEELLQCERSTRLAITCSTCQASMSNVTSSDIKQEIFF